MIFELRSELRTELRSELRLSYVTIKKNKHKKKDKSIGSAIYP